MERSTETEMNTRLSRSKQCGSVATSSFPLEPFVDPKTVSAFFPVPRAAVLRMTREGKIRGYAYKGRLRHVYRNRLSEVSADFEAASTTIESSYHQRTFNPPRLSGSPIFCDSSNILCPDCARCVPNVTLREGA